MIVPEIPTMVEWMSETAVLVKRSSEEEEDEEDCRSGGRMEGDMEWMRALEPWKMKNPMTTGQRSARPP